MLPVAVAGVSAAVAEVAVVTPSPSVVAVTSTAVAPVAFSLNAFSSVPLVPSYTTLLNTELLELSTTFTSAL